MKKIVLYFIMCAGLGMLPASGATMQQMRFHCEHDTARINTLLQRGQTSGKKTANELVRYYAHELLGTPYVAHTLEGDTEKLTINIDELDCTTFVETLYALARTTLDGRYSWRDYANNLENLRYRNGELGDYASRLHYISEWIVNNRSRGNLVEVTADLPHADYQVKTINFMSTHKDSYRSLKNDSAMLEKIKSCEVGYRNHRMPYVKRMWLGDKKLKEALRPGDFVGLVTKIEGLDISHLGIIDKDDKGEIYLLDASMSGGQVMLEKQNMMQMYRNSKTMQGIRVFRIMP